MVTWRALIEMGAQRPLDVYLNNEWDQRAAQEGVSGEGVYWGVATEQLLGGGEGDLEMEVVPNWYMHRYTGG